MTIPDKFKQAQELEKEKSKLKHINEKIQYHQDAIDSCTILKENSEKKISELEDLIDN